MTSRKRLVEETPKIDIRDLNQRHLLHDGARMSWGDPANPAITGVVQNGSLYITLLAEPKRTARIPITSKKTSRSWFIYWRCPSGCGRAVRDIFMVNSNFACRFCHDLGYRTSILRRSPTARAEHALKKLGIKLLGDPKLATPPDCPPGMRPSEYHRLTTRWKAPHVQRRSEQTSMLEHYRKLVLDR